jgi:hypothetical protein
MAGGGMEAGWALALFAAVTFLLQIFLALVMTPNAARSEKAS